MAKRTLLDWAKSKRDYGKASEAAYEEVKELFEEEPESFDGHLLASIYVDEIVRNVSVDLMKSGQYDSPEQLDKHLREFIRKQSMPQAFLEILDAQLSSSLQKFSSQLATLAEIAEITRTEGVKEPRRLDPELSSSNGSYDAPDILPLANDNVELTCVPNDEKVLDADRLQQEFSELVDIRFPLEITTNDLIFMVDYNGAFYFYGSYVENLDSTAADLSDRLERCLIEDS